MLKAMRSSTRLGGMLRAADVPPPPPPVAPAADRDLYYRVGVVLFDNLLTPTPANYAFGHAYLGGDARIAQAVDAELNAGRRLTQPVVDAIMRQAPAVEAKTISPAELAAMIGEAQARFDQFAGIVDSSRADAVSFGAALEEGAAGLAAAGSLDLQAVAALIDITNVMIESTQRVETRLRTTADEMTEVRASLAAARLDAETDPLTNLPNRRAFAARFAEAREAAIAGDLPLTVGLVDIDRFKDVNDVHGHEVGDRVIQLVARELSRACAGHLVGRHGGEEFVVLFERTPRGQAHALLDTARAGLAARVLKVAGTGRELGELTFSGGVAMLEGTESCAATIRRADQLLYRAKQAGRNRIEA